MAIQKIFQLIFIISAITLFSLTAQAQSSDLQMGSPAYRGNGCPDGSLNSTLAPDHKSLSLLFSAFVAEAGDGTGKKNARRDCQILIPFQVSKGYQVQIVHSDLRGFVGLEKGAEASLENSLQFFFWNGKLPLSRKYEQNKIYKGPLVDDIDLSMDIPGPLLTPCGVPFALVLNSALTIKANRAGDYSQIALDSVDATTAAEAYRFHFQLCK